MVTSIKPIGKSQIKIEAVGVEVHRFCNSILSLEDLGKIAVFEEMVFQFSCYGESMFLYLGLTG